MKKYIFLIVCISYVAVYSQDKKNLFKINILTPGFTFEHHLNKNNTFNLDANLSIGFSVKNTTTNSHNLNIIFGPFLRGQYRFYYNFDKRVTNGKSIYKNSGEYLALNSSYYFKPNNEYINVLDGFTLGGVWGFQKTYKCNLNLGANLGFGYNFSKNVKQDVLPIINFTVGWVIGK